MSFRFEKLAIPEVILVRADAHEDSRGYFMETYKASAFKAAGIKEDFVQENMSYSKKGVLRGLHYQVGPRAQGKLVRCLKGEIFDVAVDVRKDSENFGRWVGVKLTKDGHEQLYIPAGFAHGFCVLGDEAEVAYACTAEYAPECERGLLWNDPSVDIVWPISNPILSDKDAANPRLNESKFHE